MQDLHTGIQQPVQQPAQQQPAQQVPSSMSQQPTTMPPVQPQKKRSFFGILILGFIGLALVGVGIFGYYLLTKDEEEPTPIQTQDDDTPDPYEGWETYENEEYDFSFKYPSDWELDDMLDCEEYTEGCGMLTVMSGNYIWELWMDPVYTGGGFGFLFDMFTPPSGFEERVVTPAQYDSVMKAAYHSMDEFQESDFPYNFEDDSWGWSVVFDESGEMPGFGPVTGVTDNDISGDYFSIIYKYDIQEDDYSDLPVKGDETLEEMLDTMDKITNSFVIDEDSDNGDSSDLTCVNQVTFDEGIVVFDDLNPDDVISSPYELKGEIPGDWSFEGDCPLKIVDEDGGLLLDSFISLTGDWMTEDLVVFQATLTFDSGDATDGFLVIESSNPSGLDENCKEIRIPVKFE